MNHCHKGRPVGRVVGSWRYPVKSMGGEALTEGDVTWHCFVGDRRVDKREGRCVVITIDPVTTERDPVILRTVARDRQGYLGVYGSTVEPGRVAVNDQVLIESVSISRT
jgi:uncharacterized protein YcbX